MSYKLVLNEEIKRVPGAPSSFANLKEVITKTFCDILKDGYAIKYQDADKDWITVNSEEDFKIMMEFAPKMIPKIHVFPVGGVSMAGSQIVKDLSVSQFIEVPKVAEVPEIDLAEVAKAEKATSLKSLRRALLLLKRDITNHKLEILTQQSYKNTLKGDSLLNKPMSKGTRDQYNRSKIQILVTKYGVKTLKKDVAALESKIHELAGTAQKIKEPKIIKIDESALESEFTQIEEAGSVKEFKLNAKKEKKARIAEIKEYLCILTEKKIKVSMQLIYLQTRKINGELTRIENDLNEAQLKTLEEQQAGLKKEKKPLLAEEHDLKVEIATLKARLNRVKGVLPKKEKVWESEELNGKSKAEVERWLRSKLHEKIDGKMARESQIRAIKLEIAQHKQSKVGFSRDIQEIKTRKAKLYKELVSAKKVEVQERIKAEIVMLKEGKRKLKDQHSAFKFQIQTLKEQIKEIKGKGVKKVQEKEADKESGVLELIEHIAPAVTKFFSKENLHLFPGLVKEFAEKIMETVTEKKVEVAPEQPVQPVQAEVKQEEEKPVKAAEEIPKLEVPEVSSEQRARLSMFREMFPNLTKEVIIQLLEDYSYKTDEEMLEVFFAQKSL